MDSAPLAPLRDHRLWCTAVANLSGEAWLGSPSARRRALRGTNGRAASSRRLSERRSPAADTDWCSAAEGFIRHRPSRAARTMIHFAWPWFALLAPLPWLHYRHAARRTAGRSGVPAFPRWPFRPRTRRAAAGRARGSLPCGCSWCSRRCARRLGDPLPVPTTGRQMLLAVDVSGSMATPDMGDGATRLQSVQEVAGQFIDGRHGDQVGLILFGTQPYLQAPLTPDLVTVHRFLTKRWWASPVLRRPSAMLSALRSSVCAKRQGPNMPAMPSPAGGAGVAHGWGEQRRRHAAARGGASREGGGSSYLHDRRRRYSAAGILRRDGNNDLDEDTLKSIAKITGGEYFRAADADAPGGLPPHRSARAGGRP